MPDELLSQTQVAVILQRADFAADSYSRSNHWTQQQVDVLTQDLPALVAQDARWRALVGRIVWAMQLADDFNMLGSEAFEAKYGQYAQGDVDDEMGQALAQAQAALADAPPPTRGAAE